MLTLLQTALFVLAIMRWIVIIHIIMGWLIRFEVLNMRQPLVYQIYDSLERLLEPIYRPIRQYMPNTGGLDLSPLVVFFIIFFLERLIINNIGMFY